MLRSWAGKFNYMSDWLTPKARENQRALFAEMKDGFGGAVLGGADKEELCVVIKELVAFYLERIPVLWGAPDSIQFTIICTDANQYAWAAVFLVPVRRSVVEEHLQGAKDSWKAKSDEEHLGLIPGVANIPDDTDLPSPFNIQGLLKLVVTNCP
jgi:hypothetical protein